MSEAQLSPQKSTRPKISTPKLLALLTLFAIVPLVGLIVVPLRLSTDALDKQATDRVRDAAATNSSSIGHQIDSIETLITTVAERPSFQSPPAAPGTPIGDAARADLADLAAANPLISSTFYLDENGKVVGDSPWKDATIGTDLSYRDYFLGSMASGRPFLSGSLATKTTPVKNIVVVAQAVRSSAPGAGNGQVIGVLAASVELQATFNGYVSDFLRDRGIRVDVYDQNQNVVASPVSTLAAAANDPHIDEARQKGSWSGRNRLDGQEVASSYMEIPGTGWTVAASVNSKAAYARMDTLRDRTIGIAAGLGLVMLFGLWLLTHALRAREKAEKTARSSEQRVRTILDTAAQAYLETDRNGLATEWNNKAEDLFGWTRSEVLGEKLAELLIPADQLETVKNVVYNALRSDNTLPNQKLQTQAMRKDGSLIDAEFILWTTAVDGERFSLFVNDVTERTRFEEERELIVKRQRRLVEQLRQADMDKTDFISTVSHELRTPLTSIVGYLEMLDDGYGGELNAQQRSMWEVLDRNSRRLLRLIEDMLTLSRIESGAFKVMAMPVDVAGLVAGASQALVPALRERELEFEIDVDPAVGEVSGDLNQLERVLLNLLTNAIKFTPDGGRVSVSATREDELVTIKVADTGIGIPAEEQSKLFNRFFRASSARDRAIQGTGLGLTIVKSIIEHHGGKVEMQSVINKGTTVTVELPAGNFSQVPALN